MKNILVTGAGGMLGEKIVKYFDSQNQFTVYGTIRNRIPFEGGNVKWENLDLCNQKELHNLLNNIKPSIIIHCAANINIDNCEINSDDSEYLHSNIIEEFKKSSPNSLFIYISTDSIFNGETGNYSEQDTPGPINKYALSKLNGEFQVKYFFKEFIIIRTNIFGFHSIQNKTSLAEWALEKLNKNESINGFDDVIFNPVYTVQLAFVINNLINLNYRGIIHVGSSSRISKFSFLNLLALKFNFNENLIQRTLSQDYNFKAMRPKNTFLNTSKLEKLMDKLDLNEGLNMLYNDILNNK